MTDGSPAPDLSGRTALVTGSARGVGRAFVLALADHGADVAVHYHTSAEAATATAEAAREAGARATTVRGDVTDPEAVDALVSDCENALAPPDVLVNNVGEFEPVHWTEMSWDRWRAVLETNLDGTALCSRRVLPTMREQNWGRIVNLGYASAQKGLVAPVNFPYFVAKAGVLMFTRMLAADTQDDGITVNAVSPYVVDTSDAFPPEAPRGRWATPEDLVGAVLYFLGDAAGYVSGQNIAVDGGWLPESV
jgi:NAD(P)-dependent dehydrogenase (short-subunit alcohol dehydrogenase family)